MSTDREHRSPKRARTVTEETTTSHLSSLPVVGLHLCLVGPNHLTKLFASSFLKQDAPIDRSKWDLEDRIAIQQFERSCPSFLQRQRSTRVTERKHVHLYENGNNIHHTFPNPSHIVYVVACDPRTLDPCHMHHHPNIQHVLRDSRHDLIHVSILLCFDVNCPTMDSSSSSMLTSPREVHSVQPTLFTCWHSHLESSRQAVVQSLWKRCRWSHRVGTKTSPWLFETMGRNEHLEE